ncbi:glutaredoxin family protein [Salix suchowensis]|nr:glutaredoxin family protein [Salix suchowensis]
MGCSSSKRIEANVDVYRPPPSSFAVFDINSIQEPWIVVDNSAPEKTSNVPAPILEKLNKFENDAPRSWDEVSKALQDLKPTLNEKRLFPHHHHHKSLRLHQLKTRKSVSFHTLEELEAKIAPKPEKELKKTEPVRTGSRKVEVVNNTVSRAGTESVTESSGGGVIKSVKENIFIVRDRLEREKEGKPQKKLDLLSGFEEKCPPGGADSVVLYTTSLRGIRRTFDDCTRLKTLFELHHVVFDERNVSLHGDFLNELRGLVGEGASVPRVFIKGRYIGGVDEVVELNESGQLGRILVWARVERVEGRQACEGCGDARFVPCLECSGSCKVLIDGAKERCGKCNENGLVRCPTCL